MKHISLFIRPVFAVLLTTALCITASAAPVKSMQFKRLNTDNSRLSHNFTTSVVKDSLGFVWIGTTNGLNRYDGKNVRPYYRGELELPSSAILDIAIDRQGKMWVHTDNGDAVYDRISDRFIRKDTEIFETKERVYRERLAYMTKELGFAQRLKSTRPRTIHIDEDGRMWLGTSHGIWIYDSSDGSVTRLQEDADDPFSLSDNRVNAIFTGNDGEIWIATETGLNFINTFSSKFRKYTTIDGIGMKMSYVNSFANDGKGALWISTEKVGLFKYSIKDGTFKHYENPALRKKIMGVRYFHDRLWVLSEEGFQILNTGTGAVRDFMTDKTGSRIGGVRDICNAERCGLIFVATQNGVYTFDEKSGALSGIRTVGDIFVENVTETSEGEVWMSTYSNGAMRYFPENGSIQKFSHSDEIPGSIPENRIVASFESRDKSLWFCTFGSGIVRFDTSDYSFTAYNSRTLGKDFINDLCVSVIQDSRDNLWVGTNRGILRFNPSDMSAISFTRNDGLLNDENNQFSSYIFPNDDIFIGTADGITIFNANAVYAETTDSRIVLSDFLIGGERVSTTQPGSPLACNIDLTDKISLGSSQNNFRFDVAQLNSHQSGSNMEYRLRGFSDKWTSVGENGRIEFTNIHSGDYVLELRTLTPSCGNPIQKRVALHIAVPAYASWWALTLYFLAAAGLVVGIIMFARKRIMKREQKKQETLKQERDKEILNEKMMFLSNVVHEIKTPLTLIKSPLNNIRRSHPNDGEMLSDIRIIDNTTSYLTSLSNELLEYIRVERKGYILETQRIDLAEKVRGLLFNYSETAADRKIELSSEIPLGPVWVYADDSSLTKIINNLLTNALKYCSSRIEVRLAVSSERQVAEASCNEKSDERTVWLSVRNDGEAISDEWKECIFKPFSRIDGVKKNKVDGIGLGLSLARSLAQMQGGTLELDNSGELTEFVLKLPGCSDVSAAENEFQTTAARGDGVRDGKSGDEEDLPEEKPAPQRFSVAVAEDSSELREYIVSQLSSEYRVFSIENGTAALKCLHEHNIDLLISDIAMPEMNGIELCRKVRSYVDISHVMIIIISGMNDLSKKIECMQNGANLYIEKPFDIYYLKVCAANLLDKMNLTRKTLRNSLSAEDEGAASLSKTDREFLRSVDEVILQNFSDAAFNVENLKDALNMSKSSLLRKFNRLLNTSPNNYIRTKRLLMAAQMFDEGADRVSDVCYSCGFNSTSYFAKCFLNYFGITPIEYMKKRGE